MCDRIKIEYDVNEVRHEVRAEKKCDLSRK